MLSQYFGFKEEPFGFSPDPRCLFLSRTHREALTALEEGFSSNRGFTAMIAPPGMGKTTLLFRFLEDVRESARVVFLFDLDATCEPRDFVAYVLRDLGVNPAGSSAEMHEQLSEALIKENMAGRKFVIVIDEAQNLTEAVLERVRLLTNFENSRGKLVQVVLSGQPQLSNKLLQSSLIQLRQRISTVCHIDPLSSWEISDYMDYRVKTAGYLGRPLFSEDAVRMIAESSQGTPRVINNLCYNALALCAKLQLKQVDSAMVAKVIAALQLVPSSSAVSAPALDAPIAATLDRVPEQAADPIVAQPRKRRQFSGLRLIPDSSDSTPVTAKKPIDESGPPRFWERTRLRLVSLATATAGNVMLWVPAAALILVISFVGALRLAEVLSSPSHATTIDQTTDMSEPPAGDFDATESASPSVPVDSNSIPTKPVQSAAIPKPSPSALAPATSTDAHVASAPSSPASHSMQGGAAASEPTAAAQPVAMAPQANAQPSGNSLASRPVASSPVPSQAAPVAAAPKQVHAALAGNAPQGAAISTTSATNSTAPSVRPAFPQP
jgi:type II secretory pathway predicted ATPase ExeA